ncbi:hypothetical protein MTO98_30750 [Mucilaginibacter sp. SMC90]|uniref:hypothetical protein n=1 Tax=Mucilaginibacter sp. SMC90 TaxID=2929803 RepID=UPI001FB3F7F2|nr:hypothetical protein [Mucilaginibacter sp. SMC90]UOE48781.1 hypothetical protein MTO98_30750 [Mucilaginibacter sp. SMC90]
MDQFSKTAITGIAGTTVMTAGSQLMSVLFQENFREPDHLETLISRLVPQLSHKAKTIAGWGAHYAMGLVFAAIYVELWEHRKIKHTLRNGLILGTLSGILGYLIWKATFKAHPLAPWINYSHYYLQRIPAHIVFAVAATIAYQMTLASEETKTA